MHKDKEIKKYETVETYFDNSKVVKQLSQKVVFAEIMIFSTHFLA